MERLREQLAIGGSSESVIVDDFEEEELEEAEPEPEPEPEPEEEPEEAPETSVKPDTSSQHGVYEIPARLRTRRGQPSCWMSSSKKS